VVDCLPRRRTDEHQIGRDLNKEAAKQLAAVHRKAVKGSSKAVPMQREDAMVLEKPMETEHDQKPFAAGFKSSNQNGQVLNQARKGERPEMIRLGSAG
jgi:hypothetical protein